ncbi:phosphate/phosphite/phosphonate ABC transporter substrate-binding protein [Polymorphobacter fuscus]|uniref:Phosphate/phosphite/phosphonate ABC transporter substrate-binding protein n=2 Tax=Sandarakinorhabdus fusca TaxID=1439888 RepID=A0A7C9GPC7_9SPHN|nr:phosphate/phosphite/phosphonate ABC transporter substrate-binding protein [Polymorphobacter fuscus]KAB7648011.1 phosphate/phosphite/phosphonate ABC transporter substrate-binding protein [Polymorphobacter fuscus]MQT16953.1 phosphate/phosphite/phosphonate ABC transporter substrate-binding protein [Polymorphobacter fuscus]
MRLLWGLAALLLVSAGCAQVDTPAQDALRVVLIPADGGTEDGTKADYQPIFQAVSRMTGLGFDIRVGQSYATVVEALCNGGADIAFVGPVTYLQARDRGCAELLAVGVEDNQSTYYSGIFAKAASPIRVIADLKGKRVAFGDVNSTSSFVYPMAMILDAGLDPVRDLGAIRMTGSHAESLAALVQGQADAAALSFDSFEKAVAEHAIDPATVRVVARSPSIPYPPLIVSTRVEAGLKAKLREAFAGVHKAPGVTSDMIRGYGGKKIDRYDTAFASGQFDVAGVVMAKLDDALKADILRKASER